MNSILGDVMAPGSAAAVAPIPQNPVASPPPVLPVTPNPATSPVAPKPVAPLKKLTRETLTSFVITCRVNSKARSLVPADYKIVTPVHSVQPISNSSANRPHGSSSVDDTEIPDLGGEN